MIHSSAVIGQDVRIGDAVSIGPFCVIEDGVVIGAGTFLGPHVTVFSGVTIGNECRLHAGAVIGDVAQDRRATDGWSGVRSGDHCVLREGVTVHRGTEEGSVTEIGSQCMLMANAHCAHNVRLGEGVILANGVLLAGYVEVGDYAFLSGNSVVHQFGRIGRRAMVGGASALSQDLPPFMTSRPSTLNVVAGTNVVGMRRAGMDAEERRAVARAHRLLYRSGLTRKDAMAAIRAEFDAGPAREIADFVHASTRGVCGAG